MLLSAFMQQWIVLVWANTDGPKISRGREREKEKESRKNKLRGVKVRQRNKSDAALLSLNILTSVEVQSLCCWLQCKSSQCLQVCNDPACQCLENQTVWIHHKGGAIHSGWLKGWDFYFHSCYLNFLCTAWKLSLCLVVTLKLQPLRLTER